MNRYRLTLAVSVFGLGDILRLTAEQFAPRQESLEVIKDKRRKNGGYLDVRVKKPIEFKAGEIVELTNVPKHLAASAVDLDVEKADTPPLLDDAKFAAEASAEYEASDALKAEFENADLYVAHRRAEASKAAE